MRVTFKKSNTHLLVLKTYISFLKNYNIYNILKLVFVPHLEIIVTRFQLPY